MHSLSKKITTVVFLVSLALALATASLQLVREYKADVSLVEKALDQITSSYIHPMEVSAYEFDLALLTVQLDGLRHLPGIHCAQIYLEMGKDSRTVAQKPCTYADSLSFITHPLKADVAGQQTNIGHLQIGYSLDHAWSNLRQRAFFVLFTNILQTFIAALIILILIRYILTRPLTMLRHDLQNDEHATGNHRLQVLRGQFLNQPDELNLLVDTLNERQTKINTLFKNLHYSNSELSQILYAVCHDLRSPMVNLSGFSHESLSLLENARKAQHELPHELETELPNYLRYIESSSSTFHKQMVALGQYLGASDRKLECKPIRILDCWNAACESYTHELDKAAAEISFADPELQGIADFDALRIVFTVLIDNALKFRLSDIPLRIRITPSLQAPALCEFTLSDNGPGIPKGDSHKLFQLFYRGTNDSSGIGMGLPLSRKLLRQMNGDLNVLSTESQGFHLSIQLPGV